MTFDFHNQHGSLPTLTVSTWRGVINLALEHGWQSAEDDLLFYLVNEHHAISAADAVAMAEALSQALLGRTVLDSDALSNDALLVRLIAFLREGTVAIE